MSRQRLQNNYRKHLGHEEGAFPIAARNPHILLDHIMFTQAFVRGQLPIRVEPHAGNVEHEIFDRLTASHSR